MAVSLAVAARAKVTIGRLLLFLLGASGLNMVAFFTFAQFTPDKKLVLFVFKLAREEQITKARSIISDPNNPKRRVQGTISVSQMPYNPSWSFHLVPESIDFFENQVEVCDANVTYVEKHLDEVGGGFLPRSKWCPWTSQLLAEVTHLVDPITEELKL
jgi:hypothetical protein